MNSLKGIKKASRTLALTLTLIEFSYRYQESQRASIIMSFQARGKEDTAAVLEGLNVCHNKNA